MGSVRQKAIPSDVLVSRASVPPWARAIRDRGRILAAEERKERKKEKRLAE